MRGCFRNNRSSQTSKKVLPAYAGMFPPRRLAFTVASRSPRVCGDVSKIRERTRSVTRFSPRMRGCFLEQQIGPLQNIVLPAYAGMFPFRTWLKIRTVSSPRVCGDVSSNTAHVAARSAFSPRMRGCFRHLSTLFPPEAVLPAYAGMFLLELMMSS